MYQKTFFEDLIEINYEKKVSLENLRPWSFSKYDTFKSCPIKFFFRYVYKIEPKRNKYLAFGSGVHLIIEKLLTKPISLKEKNLFNLAKYIKENYEPLFDINYFKKYAANILNFVKNIKDNGNLFEVEKAYGASEDYVPLNYENKNVFIRGKVDLILKDKDGIRIIDHKTTGILNNRSLKKILKTLKEKSSLQLFWYASLVALKTQEKNFTISFFIVKDGKLISKRFEDFDGYKIFKKIKNKLLEVEEKLIYKNIFEVINIKDFEFYRRKNKALCEYCDYQNYCLNLFKLLKRE